jgi:hypothetical protein
MKRIVLICCMLVLAISASADLRGSDVLLTDSGVFYRVSAVEPAEFNEAHPENPVNASATSILVLTIQSEDETETIPVPASLSGNFNIEPSLAYDPNDERIYLFWQRKPSASSSELLLTSYKDGVWSEATTFDNGIWRLRYNLRIGITHYRTFIDEGRINRAPAVVAHAVWWEQLGQHESARYAMLNLSAGEVTGLTIRDMSELSSLPILPEARELPEGYDKNTFRTPFILDVPGNDSVDILFADWYTNHYEIVNVRPVLDEKNGVLHIPIGVTSGVMDAPGLEVRDADAGLMAMSAPSPTGGKDLLLYSPDETAIDYVIYRNGVWSESRKILLRENVTIGEALVAMRRNLTRN